MKNRIGETKQMNCGYYATIIKYNGTNDIVVRFNDENQTEKHSKYQCFKTGMINNLSNEQRFKNINDASHKKCLSYVGKQFTARNGQKFTIIEYIDNQHTTVQFEDGTIVRNKIFGNVLRGQVLNPSYTPDEAKIDNYKNIRVGQSITNQYGEKITIINYKDYRNVTVNIETKTGKIIMKRVTAKQFDQNSIVSNLKEAIRNSKIGLTNTFSNGMKATIIEYHSAHKIRVRFEDGYEKNSCYKLFKNGEIRHGSTDENIGTIWKCKNGLNCEVIEYKSKKQTTVKFDDGTIVKNMNMSAVRKGLAPHPLLKNINGKYKNIEFHKIPYLNTTYYKCNCLSCGFIGLFTAHELVSHSLSHSN